MYGVCTDCSNKEINASATKPSGDTIVKYKLWETVKEKRQFKDGKEKMVSFVMKKEHSDVLDNVWILFHTQLQSFKRHFYNLESQFKFYRKLRSNLTEDGAIIHVDFAENYVSKWDSEIQSAHFGASKKQLSLHTGYFKIGGQDEVHIHSVV